MFSDNLYEAMKHLTYRSFSNQIFRYTQQNDRFLNVKLLHTSSNLLQMRVNAL